MVIDDEKSDGFEETSSPAKVKFEIYGEELIEKTVKSSGNSGRVYLPPEWIGTKVKVVKC
jgi:putative transposon-encoded protein